MHSRTIGSRCKFCRYTSISLSVALWVEHMGCVHFAAIAAVRISDSRIQLSTAMHLRLAWSSGVLHTAGAKALQIRKLELQSQLMRVETAHRFLLIPFGTASLVTKPNQDVIDCLKRSLRLQSRKPTII